MLNPTPTERLMDESGRPYFLPPEFDMTLDQYRKALEDPDLRARAVFQAPLLRNARPDDVFFFTAPGAIRETWPLLEPYLGHRKEFWGLLLELFEDLGFVRG
jgi:hypothetical protein